MLRVAEDLFYYPDVLVVCDPQDTEERYKTRPCVVVEVLSPGTEATDRRKKVLACRRMQSLKAYSMVDRDEHGAWWQAEVAGERLVPFPSPPLTLSLDESYEGLVSARGVVRAGKATPSPVTSTRTRWPGRSALSRRRRPTRERSTVPESRRMVNNWSWP